MEPFTDKAGNKLTPGDIIVHGQPLGRCSGLRYAKVLGLVPYKKDKFFGTTTSKGDRKCKLRIIAVDAEWTHRKPEIADKPSLLSFGDRMLKVTDDQVPEKVLTLLRNYIG